LIVYFAASTARFNRAVIYRWRNVNNTLKRNSPRENLERSLFARRFEKITNHVVCYLRDFNLNIRELIDEDSKDALRAHEAERLSTLRMLKSALMNAEIAAGHDLTDTETLQVLEKQAKQRRDSVEQFTAGGRQDLATKESAELGVIEKYLPAKMSREEIELLVQQAIAELGANSAADMGKVIQAVMGKAAGSANGKEVSEIVKSKLV